MGKPLGVTFNDVILACQAKAVRLYFEEKEPGKDFGPVACLMGLSERDNSEISNQVTGSIVKYELPLDPASSLEFYLSKVKKEMQYLKDSAIKYSAPLLHRFI